MFYLCKWIKKYPITRPHTILNPKHILNSCMCAIPISILILHVLFNSKTTTTLYKFMNKEYNSTGSGLGVGSEGAAGEKNMHDAEFTCALFRFIQLTCEGHNLGKYWMHYSTVNITLKYFSVDWQNYLRTQAGNTTTVNVVICTVDYLLRLQESIMDFYWHYSSKVLFFGKIIKTILINFMKFLFVLFNRKLLIRLEKLISLKLLV